jgi:hypothetical protein
MDDSGNSYLCGTFRHSIWFGSDSLMSSGNNDVFIAKLDLTGNFDWALSCGGNAEDYAGGIKAGSTDIFIAGYFYGTMHFGTSLSLTGDSATSDIFLARLNAFTGIAEEGNDNEFFYCYPNPAKNILEIKFLKPGKADDNYEISDSKGALVLSGRLKDNSISVQGLTAGNYFVKLKMKEGDITKQFIVLQ